jgi:ankyrin repeat protein
VINGHYDLAAWLIERGADPNVADKWGRAALYAAIDMQTLEPSVTRPAPKTNDQHTALDVARIALQHGAKVEAVLVEPTPGRGVSDNPDPVLRAGTTPFLRAAKTGDVAGMRLLLEHGANPQAMTNYKVTALMAASGLGWRYGDSEVAEADGLAAVKLCVELGLDVNAVDNNGRGALHGAAERGGTALVEYLVAHGATVDAKDKGGKTPLDIAKGNSGYGNPEYPATVMILSKLKTGPK